MDATYRIQSATGTVDPAASGGFTATLPNSTQSGSTLMLWVAMSSGTINVPAVDPPWIVDASLASVMYVLRRDNQPGGETSWAMPSSFSARWAWRAEEWASWSTASQPDSAASSVHGITGAQDNFGFTPTADVADFAGLAIFKASGGAGVGIFPLRTYSSGWSEVDCVTVGTGTAGTDVQLIIAETYPGVTGVIDPHLVWDTSNGGTYTDKTVNTWSACYQPAVTVPFGVLTA